MDQLNSTLNRCLCPTCKNSTLEVKHGKFGKFISCQDVNCNYTLSYDKRAKAINEYKQLDNEEFYELMLSKMA